MPRRTTRKPAEQQAPKQPAEIPGQGGTPAAVNEAPATEAPKVDLDEAIPAATENTPAGVEPAASPVDAEATAAAADPAATTKAAGKMRKLADYLAADDLKMATDSLLRMGAAGIEKADPSRDIKNERQFYRHNVTNSVAGKYFGDATGVSAGQVDVPYGDGKAWHLQLNAKGQTPLQAAEAALPYLQKKGAGFNSAQEVLDAAAMALPASAVDRYRSTLVAADPDAANLDDMSVRYGLQEAMLKGGRGLSNQTWHHGIDEAQLFAESLPHLLARNDASVDLALEKLTKIDGFAARLRQEVVKEQQAGGDGSGVLKQVMDWMKTVNPTPYGEKTPEMLKGMANWQHLGAGVGAGVGAAALASAMAGGGGGGDDDQYLALLAAQNASRPAY